MVVWGSLDLIDHNVDEFPMIGRLLPNVFSVCFHTSSRNK